MTSLESTSGSLVVNYENSESFARLMDEQDPLKHIRAEFLIPRSPNDRLFVYMAGNSLGLQPLKAREYINNELADWAALGVEGHLHARHPWLPYHENLTEMTARLVGAKPSEVVVMNSLTVNLHLMMVSFYRPTKSRYKIVIEGSSFPSDQYAVSSQAKFHGFDPSLAVVELLPRVGEDCLRTDDILSYIEAEGESIALVLLGSCNYLTGQAFDLELITKLAQKKGSKVGVNLAHGVGNLNLRLHDWNLDFAVWCSYKYLNAGPGAIAGCFVHERFAKQPEMARFAGWWGHDKESRFLMGPVFNPIDGAEGWQLSNPPIFQLAALRASMEIFDKVGMAAIRKKGDLLTGYLEFLLSETSSDIFQLITPKNPRERGSQLSFRLKGKTKQLVEDLKNKGAICDFREPNIVRAAPCALYNSYTDVYNFARLLSELI